MYCRQCGMDSRTPDVCEWCKKPMAQQPAQPVGVATAPQTAAAGARVPANLAGLPPEAVSPQMLRAEAQQAETPWGERLEKFLAMGMPLLIGHLLVRFVLALAFATSADPLSMIPQFSLLPSASFVAAVCSFGGWMMSSFFRPLNR